jgi:pilin isopeptide linkage protein
MKYYYKNFKRIKIKQERPVSVKKMIAKFLVFAMALQVFIMFNVYDSQPSASTIPYLWDEASTFVTTLYNESEAPVVTGDTVYYTSSLHLQYEFSMSFDKVNGIRNKIESSIEGYYAVRATLPDGLILDESAVEQDLFIEYNDGTLEKFATLCFVPAEHYLYLRFEGEFWETGEVIYQAFVFASCRLDESVIGSRKEYTFYLKGASNSVTVNIGDAVTPPEVEKSGRYNYETGMFEWEIVYEPGAILPEQLPVTIIDSFNNREHNFVQGSLKRNGVEVPPTGYYVTESVQNSDGYGSYGDTHIEIFLPTLPDDTVVFTFNTAPNSRALIANMDNWTFVDNTVKLRDALGGEWSPSSASAVIPPDDKQIVYKYGDIWDFEMSGVLPWVIELTPPLAGIHSLKLEDTIMPGFELDISSICIQKHEIINGAYYSTSDYLTGWSSASNYSGETEYHYYNPWNQYNPQDKINLDVYRTFEISGNLSAVSAHINSLGYSHGQFISLSGNILTLQLHPNNFHNYNNNNNDAGGNWEQRIINGITALPGVTSVTDTGTTFTLEFEPDPEGAYGRGYSRNYRISYNTHPTDSFISDTTFNKVAENHGTVSYTPIGGNPVDIPFSAYVIIETPIIKKNGSYNPTDGTIDWLIVINPYNLELVDGIVTDDLSKFEGAAYNNGDMTYVPGSLKYDVRYPYEGANDTPFGFYSNMWYSSDFYRYFDQYMTWRGDPVRDFSDYTGLDKCGIVEFRLDGVKMNSPADENTATPRKLLEFDIDAAGIREIYGDQAQPRSTIYIAYKTKLENPAHYGLNLSSYSKYYRNEAEFDGKVLLRGVVTPVNDSAVANTYVSSNVLTKNPITLYETVGSSYSAFSYNYNNNELVWRITLNQNKMAMPDAVIKDVLPDYMTLIGVFITDNPPTINTSVANHYPDAYKNMGLGSYPPGVSATLPDVSNNNTLTVNLGDYSDGKTTYIFIKTVIDTDKHSEFSTKNPVKLSNSAILERTGFADVKADASLEVSNKTISKTAKVVGSKISYAVNVNGNGMDVAGIPLTDKLPFGLKLDTDSVKLYQAQFNPRGDQVIKGAEASVGEWTWSYDAFDNSFTITINTDNFYLLEYDCYASASGTYRNDIAFEGSHFTSDVGKASKSEFVAGGGASGVAARASLAITKLDSESPHIPLSGVSFELWTEIRGVPTIVDKGKTNVSGKLTFDLLSPFRTYWLVETGGKTGYDAASALVISQNGAVLGTPQPLGADGYKLINPTANQTTNITVHNDRITVTPIDVLLTGSKEFTDGTIEEGLFRFNVIDDERNIAAHGESQIDGTVVFTPLHYTATGIYRYRVSELDKGAPNITYDTSVYDVTVTVTSPGGGVLTADVVYSKGGTDGVLEFTNTVSAPKIPVTLLATKELINEDMNAGMFSFVLTDSSGTEVAKATNTGCTDTVTHGTLGHKCVGGVTFSPVSLSAGTYNFRMSEIDKGAAKISYDSAVHNVTVVVSDNGSGTLIEEITYPAAGNVPPVFTNEYFENSVKVTLSATKTLIGAEDFSGKYAGAGNNNTLTLIRDSSLLQNNMFSFLITDSSKRIVSTGTNDVNGKINFSPIHYTSPGTYNYIVTEVNGGCGGITYSAEKFYVKVVVEPDGDELLAEVFYLDGNINFENEISKQVSNVIITARKEYFDGAIPSSGSGDFPNAFPLNNDDFSFVVENEEGKVVSAGTNRANGTVIFSPLKFTEAGVYRYTVREINGGGTGIEYDTSVFNIIVTVTGNSGDLQAAVTYTNGSLMFRNFHYDDGVDVYLNGAFTKRLEIIGSSSVILKQNDFGFVVVDEDGKIVSAGTNRADGDIHFGKIHLDSAGIYNYKVYELAGNTENVVYDKSVFDLVVTVEHKAGKLEAAYEIFENDSLVIGNAEFVNYYSEHELDMSLEATKLLTGATLEAGTFSFVMEDKNGNPVTFGTNNSLGNIQFGAVHYTLPGEYEYKMYEVRGRAAGFTYSAEVYDVTVTVGFNGTDLTDGGITYRRVSDNTTVTEAVFENLYQPRAVEVVLDGTKNLTGRPLRGGLFGFAVKDEHGKVVSTGINANSDGDIVFTPILFDTVGTYEYTVTELNGGLTLGGITHDSAEFNITVAVTDNHGQLVAEILYNGSSDGGIEFNNSYTQTNDPYATLALSGEKTLTGTEMTTLLFGFVAEDENDNVVSVGTNTASGQIVFSPIYYTASGEYKYTISEINNSLEGFTYDSTKFDVTVTVDENSQGELIITAIDYGGVAEITFDNSFIPPTQRRRQRTPRVPVELIFSTSVIIEATKAVTANGGVTVPLTDFAFTLTQLNSTDPTDVMSGGVTRSSVRSGAGTVSFNAITGLTSEGSPYYYKVEEINGGGDGWNYDTTPRIITVTVTEVAYLLQVNVVYTSGSATFTNVYGSGATTTRGVYFIPNESTTALLTTDSSNTITSGSAVTTVPGNSTTSFPATSQGEESTTPSSDITTTLSADFSTTLSADFTTTLSADYSTAPSTDYSTAPSTDIITTLSEDSTTAPSTAVTTPSTDYSLTSLTGENTQSTDSTTTPSFSDTLVTLSAGTPLSPPVNTNTSPGITPPATSPQMSELPPVMTSPMPLASGVIYTTPVYSTPSPSNTTSAGIPSEENPKAGVDILFPLGSVVLAGVIALISRKREK